MGDWQAAGQWVLVVWIILIGVFFFAQYLPHIDTGLNVVRRILQIP